MNSDQNSNHPRQAADCHAKSNKDILQSMSLEQIQSLLDVLEDLKTKKTIEEQAHSQAAKSTDHHS